MHYNYISGTEAEPDRFKKKTSGEKFRNRGQDIIIPFRNIIKCSFVKFIGFK